MCFFVSRPMKLPLFLRKTVTTNVDFSLRKTHSENKIMDIVEDFVEKSYNNNGKPWKSSGILRVKTKTLEIFRDFAFVFILPFFLKFLHISTCFFIFHHFSSFSTFYIIFVIFLHCLIFIHFSSFSQFSFIVHHMLSFSSFFNFFS